MNSGSQHRLTPAAIFIVFVLIIPGLVLGQLVSFVYGWFLSGMFDGNPIDWAAGGWFKIIVMAIIPNAIAGFIGGLVGLRLTYLIKPLRQANYEIVAYAMSTIVLVFTALALFMIFRREGFDVTIVETIANTVGVIAGLFGGQKSVEEDQRSKLAQATTAS